MQLLVARDEVEGHEVRGGVDREDPAWRLAGTEQAAGVPGRESERLVERQVAEGGRDGDALIQATGGAGQVRGADEAEPAVR